MALSLRFAVCGRKQTDRHTRAHAQCSPTRLSVGLAQPINAAGKFVQSLICTIKRSNEPKKTACRKHAKNTFQEPCNVARVMQRARMQLTLKERLL